MKQITEDQSTIVQKRSAQFMAVVSGVVDRGEGTEEKCARYISLIPLPTMYNLQSMEWKDHVLFLRAVLAFCSKRLDEFEVKSEQN